MIYIQINQSITTMFQRKLEMTPPGCQRPSSVISERWSGSCEWIALSLLIRELSSLEYSSSHSTQAAPYTRAKQNQLSSTPDNRLSAQADFCEVFLAQRSLVLNTPQYVMKERLFI